MQQDTCVTRARLDAFEEDFDRAPVNAVAMNAVVNNGLVNAAKNYELARRSLHTFSVSLEQGKITSQKQSGRCWLFAGLNTMRAHMIARLKLEDFELSQAYLFFWDQLEKSNYFLESILETLPEPTGGRLIAHLLGAPVGDGGQWDMFCNLVRKYGVVPKSAYPESASSSASREMNRYLTEKLREYACTLRGMHAGGQDEGTLRKAKDGMMAEVYRILCICLGKPPKTFSFEYRDKDKAFHREDGLTPQAFYEKYIGWDLDDYVSLINAPTEGKPRMRSYTVKFLGNVKEGHPVRYLNLEIGELKRAAIAQMRDGEPVWFGCDVGKYSDRENGLLDLECVRMDRLLSTRFGMTKGERLDYGQSLMTHAMVFQGVNLDESGVPDRWRVENSWGGDVGKDGYYVMTDRWFDEYVYQVVIHKKYLSAEQLAAYKAQPIPLEPWDPMGSLA